MSKFTKAEIKAMANKLGISIGAHEGSPYPTMAQLEAFACLSVELKSKRILDALDCMDHGCREPGFQGHENGLGDESAGNELQAAREELERLVGHEKVPEPTFEA